MNKTEKMRGCVALCAVALTNLKEINLNNFNTEKATFMRFMFQNCINLSKLEIDNFNTKNCTLFHFMFGNCKKLKELKINHFNVENAISISGM